jgi:hypothetical protein
VRRRCPEVAPPNRTSGLDAPRAVAPAKKATTAGRVLCGATRIRSHLLLLGLQERLPNFGLPHRKSGRAALILSMMRLCGAAKEITRPRRTVRNRTREEDDHRRPGALRSNAHLEPPLTPWPSGTLAELWAATPQERPGYPYTMDDATMRRCEVDHPVSPHRT